MADEQVRERPILFQGAMVRALLAGTKTQTRRAIKLPHMNPLGTWEPTTFGGPDGGRTSKGKTIPLHAAIWHTRTGDCLGSPWLIGDRLWVREAWGYFDPDGSGQDLDGGGLLGQYRDEMMQEGHPLREYWRRRIAYKATFAEQKYGMGPVAPAKWRSSIHMPRWANRILLEVTDVRVERLQVISESDVLAEGCKADEPEIWWQGYQDCGEKLGLMHQQAKGATPPDWMVEPHKMNPTPWLERDARQHFRTLWHQINGADSWDMNPWVWAVSFNRVTP
jgi:hypothetical protein